MIKSNSKCSDMQSYNIGKQVRGDERRGSQLTGETFSCDEYWNQLYSNTDKKCFCKGFREN